MRTHYSMDQYRLYKRQSINCRRGFCCLLKSQTYDLRWVTFSDKNCTAIAGHQTLCGSGTIVGHLGKNSTHGLFAGCRVSSTLCSCCCNMPPVQHHMGSVSIRYLVGAHILPTNNQQCKGKRRHKPFEH